MPISIIDVRERVMSKNDKIADTIRLRLGRTKTPAFNLISSPGAGKTLLLERTLEALNTEMEIAVVTGDCQTQNDADRLARHTGRLVQAVITNGGCHLDASQIDKALDAIDLEYTDLLLIENVGNLVCPAGWDLGEDSKIVLFSVTEGEDKPLKYPNAFRNASYVIFTKLDLLPHVDFDMNLALNNARAVNRQLRFFFTSAKSGQGMRDWFEFLNLRVNGALVPAT
ncbi:MAG TPA: hydrogenase nickel incorporation protein HypB [Gemmatimonadaceae bacterium]|nr:hydrogenase nickel incorporation protein HypB [Gemmatimonadaceae bacterium]